MPRFPFDLVLIDIDGTITRQSGWKYFAEQLGRSAEYEAMNELYLSGRTTEDAHLRDLLGIVAGTPISQLEAWMESTPKLTGVSETVEELRALGAVPALLSHNPGYVSQWYARRFGFADWDGTRRRAEPEVVLGKVEPPGSIEADKLGGIERLVRRHPTDLARVAHVGDGAADAAVFPFVGYGIALNSASQAVDRAADLALRIDDLRGILVPLRTARARVPEKIKL